MATFTLGVIYSLTMLCALSSNFFKDRMIVIAWFFVMLCYSYSLRINIHGDLEGLSILMQQPWLNTTYDQAGSEGYLKKFFPHYAREFIFWYSLRILYLVTNNVQVVFMIMDFLIFLAIYRGFTLIRDGFFPLTSYNSGTKYMLFGCMLFFPYLMGIDLLYRQFFATVVALCAIGYAAKNESSKGLFSFAIAFFIHNSIFLLAPLFLFLINRYYSRYVSLILLIVFPLLIIFILNSDSGWFLRSAFEIGERIAYIHLLGFIITLIGIIILNRLSENQVLSVSTMILVLMFCGVVLVTPSGSAERVAFIIWTVLYPLLAFYMDEIFKKSKLMRLAFIHISLAPLFIQYNNII